MKQLQLPFAEDMEYAAEDFCAAPSNAMAREVLARPESWSNGRLVLWGEPGCGKTHLLHIWAKTNRARIYSGPALHGVIRPSGPVAVDDADITTEPVALLHLLNAAAEAAQPVLMTARLPPARQSFKLADLASRLRSASSVEIRGPEEELLEMLVTRLAAERQLSLSISAQNFLLRQLPRTAAAMREAIARLDRAALDRRARITGKLAAAILGNFEETALD